MYTLTSLGCFTSVNNTTKALLYRWQRHRYVLTRSVIWHWPNLSDIEPIWYWIHLLNLSDTNSIRYWTYQIVNLLDTEPTRYQTCQISNLSDTEPIRYWTYQMSNLSHTEPIRSALFQILRCANSHSAQPGSSSPQLTMTPSPSQHATPVPSPLTSPRWPSTTPSVPCDEIKDEKCTPVHSPPPQQIILACSVMILSR